MTIPGTWDVLDSLGSPGTRPYVVAARASDTLTLLRWWERVEAGEVRVWPRPDDPPEYDRRTGKRKKPKRHPLVIQGRPDIIGYTVQRCPFRWVSVSNWADVGPVAMAAQVGQQMPECADPIDTWDAPRWPADDQSRLILSYMRRLIDYWLGIQGGAWKDTPGAAAWSTFLRQGGDSAIVRHTDPQVQKLESRAVFGGRAAVWQHCPIGTDETWGSHPTTPDIGPYTRRLAGPVHRFDVRAMYPSLLGSQRFPVRLLNHFGTITVAELESWCQRYCAVATVVVESDRGEIPHRGERGTEYPVGMWQTTLTTPELIDCLSRREVREVRQCAVYQPGTPFRQWSDWILGLREAKRIARDRAGEMLVKTISVSLGGRLGKVMSGWHDSPNTPPLKTWGQWLDVDADTGEQCYYRSLAGHVQVMTREDVRPGTLGACFAHLTAYGRSFMRSIRERLIPEDVIWQDTDGIIVTDRGAESLREMPEYHPTNYGAIRYERTFYAARFLTAKHYWADGRWVLAGIHDGFSVGDGMVSSELLHLNPARSAVRPDNAAIGRVVRHIDLSAIDPGVTVDEKGRMVPPKRWAGCEARPRAAPNTPPLPVEQG